MEVRALQPTYSWATPSTSAFVNERVPNADLYQLLAYATALDLPGGMLIYAEGEAEPVVHEGPAFRQAP